MNKFIAGKHINLRDVDVSDAAFILSLRLDPQLSKHLSRTDNDLLKQEAWISKYRTLTNEYYFIIESKDGTPYGTIRIYDIRDNSFCWGSWIVMKETPHYVAMESALLIYEFGFKILHFDKSHFDVRKDNERVVSFHKRFGAEISGEDPLNYYFIMTRDAYATAKQKYAKFME